MSTTTVLPSLLRIPIGQVVPGPNARGDLGDLTELRTSIAAMGILTPVIVEPVGADRYRLIEGHRRHACAKALGFTHIDAVLRRVANDGHRLRVQLAIHAQRAPFDPIAEARALATLMFDHGISREDLALVTGHTPGWVRDRLVLLQLTDAEQAEVARGDMTIGRAIGLVYSRRGGEVVKDMGFDFAAAARRGRATEARQRLPEPHLNARHRLAGQARARCRHDDRPRIGLVACGECWESAIRADVVAEAVA
jgi:ParB family transcriptional regulator, chromosome partitioning protein